MKKQLILLMSVISLNCAIQADSLLDQPIDYLERDLYHSAAMYYGAQCDKGNYPSLCPILEKEFITLAAALQLKACMENNPASVCFEKALKDADTLDKMKYLTKNNVREIIQQQQAEYNKTHNNQ